MIVDRGATDGLGEVLNYLFSLELHMIYIYIYMFKFKLLILFYI